MAIRERETMQRVDCPKCGRRGEVAGVALRGHRVRQVMVRHVEDDVADMCVVPRRQFGLFGLHPRRWLP